MYYSKIILVIADTLFINASLLAALYLRFESIIPIRYLLSYRHSSLFLTISSLIVFTLLGLYRSLWNYAGLKEFVKVGISILINVALLLGYTLITSETFPRSVYLIFALLALISVGGLRITYRFLRRCKGTLTYNHKVPLIGKRSRILLVGAGEAASLVVKEASRYWPFFQPMLIAVDDNLAKQKSYLNGVRICGKIKDIPSLVEHHHINRIIIAIPSASKERITEIIEVCNTTSCKLEIFPGIKGAISEPFSLNQLRPVSIEDLLGRDEIILDQAPLHTYIKDKVVLVTGGGGSIGSELCRQIALYHPKKLIIFDIYENNAYELQNELLANGFPPDALDVIIGSVRDQEKLDMLFSQLRPQVVFHAAAHKHVPLMEANPSEAIKNNVFGTLHTALCAREYKVEKFILISTDKAVNPTNIMGASKRLCEMIIQGLARSCSSTSFAAVRFGNVLGSNGSVIPLFKRQLELGGPLTVTHEEITRYFMTIPEAVRLILQATLFAKGGEIFVLDMGKPVKIMDLAKNFIKLSGLELGKDIEIKVTGLRPGEKLYEELLMNEEGLTHTGHKKIFIGKPSDINIDELIEALYQMQDCIYNEKALKEAVINLVCTYQPTTFDASILCS